MFHPGYSKEFWDEMTLSKGFSPMHNQLDLQLNELKVKYGWEILDFRPYKWKEPQLEFPDGVHPSKRAAVIMNNKIKKLINNGL